VDDELVAKNTQAVTAYFDYCSDWIEPERISFMLVPTSGLILEEKLPDHAILFAQENYMDEIRQSIEDYNFMDVRQILQEHNQEYIYYKTDHHWTTDGAYWAYQQWCSQTGHTFREKDQYEELTVTDAFRGSLYSKILDYDSAYDQIHVLQPVGEQESYEVVADGIDIGGFYQEDKLEQKDKYAYFFGGNYGEVRITNTALVQSKQNHTKERNLLVIKDSFANTFVPLIAQEYDHVYMVDLRYYNNDMAGYISENNITDILVLYNVSNFISDKNIYKLISNIPE
jgi:hypothetical protein